MRNNTRVNNIIIINALCIININHFVDYANFDWLVVIELKYKEFIMKSNSSNIKIYGIAFDRNSLKLIGQQNHHLLFTIIMSNTLINATIQKTQEEFEDTIPTKAVSKKIQNMTLTHIMRFLDPDTCNKICCLTKRLKITLNNTLPKNALSENVISKLVDIRGYIETKNSDQLLLCLKNPHFIPTYMLTRVTDSHGDTPLHVAVNTNAVELVTELLNCKASMYAKNISGCTPLNSVLNIINSSNSVIAGLWITENNIEIVNLFLESGATVDNMGSMLHWAISKQSSKLVKSCLNNKSDANSVFQKGVSPLTKAINTSYKLSTKISNAQHSDEIVKNLRNAYMVSLEIVELLLQHGANVNEDEGRHLMRASYAEDSKLAELLLKYNANIGSELYEKDTWNCIKPEIKKLLMAYGVSAENAEESKTQEIEPLNIQQNLELQETKMEINPSGMASVMAEQP